MRHSRLLVVATFIALLRCLLIPTSELNGSTVAFDGINDVWKDKLRASEEFTGFRYVKNLTRNVPYKVSWSSNVEMYRSWIQLPLPNSTNGANPSEVALVSESLSYAIIRDPLERLYSGFYNKCHKPSEIEDHCTGYTPTQRKANPPTFIEFLRSNFRRDGFRVMHENAHYKPITKAFPNLGGMDHVFNMASADYNRDISHMWKRLGANHSVVDKVFPTQTPRKKQFYHSGTTLENIQERFAECETLHLGMIACNDDYEGPFAKQYFPIPSWVSRKLQECGNEGKPLTGMAGLDTNKS